MNDTSSTPVMDKNDELRVLNNLLVSSGRRLFCPTAEVSRGTILGKSISHVNDVEVVVDAAISMMEDWNGHLSVAALRAIEKKEGKVTRKGRVLTIILPEYWEQISNVKAKRKR